MQVFANLISFDDNFFTIDLCNRYFPLPIYEIQYDIIYLQRINRLSAVRKKRAIWVLRRVTSTIINHKEYVNGGPSGIRTHDLSNANAVSYRTRRSAHNFDLDLHINIFRLIMFLLLHSSYRTLEFRINLY